MKKKLNEQEFHKADQLALGQEMFESMWGVENWKKTNKFYEKMHPWFRDLALRTWAPFARPNLEPKWRSLVNIVTLATIGDASGVKAHVNAGLSNGLTPDQIREAMLQLAPYAGLPKTRDGLKAAEESISKWKPYSDKRDLLG